MKIKVYVIDMDIPKNAKRWLLRVGLPVVMILGGLTIAYAAVPMWKPNQPLKADDLNSAFGDLQNQIPVVSYVEQTADVTTASDGTWADVPGLAISITPAVSGNADLEALVWISTASTNPGASACSVRFLLDGAELLSGRNEGTLPVAARYTVPYDVPFVALRRVPITATGHSVKIQIQKYQGVFAGATCSATNGRLRVTTRR